jgi:hypothetical protein
MSVRTTSEALIDESTMDAPSLSRTLSDPPEEETSEKPKKAKADSKKKKGSPAQAEGDTKRPKKEATPTDQPKSKRGQARPHRRLDTETITARIEKLDKRIKRATAQVVDATRNVEGYRREMTFRPSEKSLEEKLEETLEEKLEGKQDGDVI